MGRLKALGGFAARVELDQPDERSIDERMIGAALGEEEVRIGSQIEAARVAIALRKLHEELSSIFRVQAFDHAGNLARPKGVAFGPLDQLLHVPAARGQLAKHFEILRRQVGLRSAGITARSECDAAENPAGIARVRNAAEEKF